MPQQRDDLALVFPGRAGFLADLTGTWQISGVSSEAGGSTQFEQAFGFFAIGSFVEVKYTASGSVNTAVEIETHVAPGSGLNPVFGHLRPQAEESPLDGPKS